MSRLVGDLLLLARADAGRLDAHRRCDLAEIAGDAAAEAAPLMGDRTLVVDNDRPLRVEGSPDELHRMVLNLLDNATRHTPAGADDRAAACARTAATRWSRSPTTAPASRPRCATQIFDRFVRGEGPADTARGTGTGLGLAIVSAVADSHGGSVEAAESELRRRPLPRPHPPGRPLSEAVTEAFKGALGPRPRFPRGRDTWPAGASPQTPPRRALFRGPCLYPGRLSATKN